MISRPDRRSTDPTLGWAARAVADAPAIVGGQPLRSCRLAGCACLELRGKHVERSRRCGAALLAFGLVACAPGVAPGAATTYQALQPTISIDQIDEVPVPTYPNGTLSAELLVDADSNGSPDHAVTVYENEAYRCGDDSDDPGDELDHFRFAVLRRLSDDAVPGSPGRSERARPMLVHLY
ncbi:hypothetical protein B7486_68520, partial [cyanobacterium TDX16]